MPFGSDPFRDTQKQLTAFNRYLVTNAFRQ